MADKIRIKVLGEFQLNVNETSYCTKNDAQKWSELLRLLILKKGKSVSSIELCKALWADARFKSPLSSLKTLVCRTRIKLDKISGGLAECIDSTDSGYRFKLLENCEVDLFIFDRLCGDLSSVHELTEDSRKEFLAAQRLITIDFICFRASTNRMIQENEEIHNQYLNVVGKFIALLMADKEYEEIIRVCREALDIDPFDEQFHVALLESLIRLGRDREALTQYEHVAQMYSQYLKSSLPESIQELYKNLITLNEEIDISIAEIRNQIGTQIEGAFVCDYSVLKIIAQLQARIIARSALTLSIVLIQVDQIDGLEKKPLLLNSIMKKLMHILKENLRKGDIISQYNASQYVLLLSMKDVHMANLVMERIRDGFYKEQTNAGMRMTYKIDTLK